MYKLKKKVLGDKTIQTKKVVPVIKKKKKQVFQAIRGMKDILPGDQPYWEQIRRVSEKLARDYGFLRLDTPILEQADLFIRNIGAGTDIVEKEMYVFTTRGKDRVALRPELTAGNCRSFIQNGMQILSKPVKIFSVGNVYRYDRPQEGRQREHFQINFDAFGEKDPVLDAQVIQVAGRMLQCLGIKSFQIQVNSIGCPVCRKEYLQLLSAYWNSKKSKLCYDCKKRMKNNPLRVFDCKEDKCFQATTSAPQTVDHLCDDCRKHFKFLLEYLDELELPYAINSRLVRGLDYYTKTVFEIWSGGEEMQGKMSLGGGGRYDELIKFMGGEDTPAVGFAMGAERLVLEMKKVQAKPYKSLQPKIFLAQLGNLAKKKSLRLLSELEKNGILVAESFGRGGLKSQLRMANKRKVKFTLILGQKEALDGSIIIKDMETGVQETVNAQKLVDIIKKRIKSENVVIYKNGLNNNK